MGMAQAFKSPKATPSDTPSNPSQTVPLTGDQVCRYEAHGNILIQTATILTSSLTGKAICGAELGSLGKKGMERLGQATR